MKKTKLLLPIMTVGALTAVTPAVLVSCNKDDSASELTIKQDEVDLPKINDKYFYISIIWDNFYEGADVSAFSFVEFFGTITIKGTEQELDPLNLEPLSQKLIDGKGKAQTVVKWEKGDAFPEAGTYKAHITFTYKTKTNPKGICDKTIDVKVVEE